jgi:hypothetical protein
MARAQTQTFEELLVSSEILSPVQLAMAQRDAQMRKRPLAPTLIELGLIDGRRFAEWMSQATKLPLVDPLPVKAVEPLVRRIPRTIAREHEILPLAIDGLVMSIAMVNPLDQAAIDVVRATTAMNIRPVIAVYEELARLLAMFYPEEKVEPPPRAVFDPSETIAARSPDDFDETNPVVDVTPESQLDRIERGIGELHQMMEELKQRLDALAAPKRTRDR